jgi:hypothetical protein
MKRNEDSLILMTNETRYISYDKYEKDIKKINNKVDMLSKQIMKLKKELKRDE